MAIFENIKYIFFDKDDKQIGESNHFYGGLKENPKASYAEKYIGEEFKQRISVTELTLN